MRSISLLTVCHMHNHWGVEFSSMGVKPFNDVVNICYILVFLMVWSQQYSPFISKYMIVGMMTATLLLCELRSFLLLPDFPASNLHYGLGLDTGWSVKHFFSAATGNLFGSTQHPSRDLHTPISTWKRMLLSKPCPFPMARIHVRCYWGAPLHHAEEQVGVWLAVHDCIFEGVCVYVYVGAWRFNARKIISNQCNNGNQRVFDACGWVCCRTLEQQTKRGRLAWRQWATKMLQADFTAEVAKECVFTLNKYFSTEKCQISVSADIWKVIHLNWSYSDLRAPV